MRTIDTLLVACALSALLCLGGCSGAVQDGASPVESELGQGAAGSGEGDAVPGSATPIEALTPSQKSAAIDESFPPEVPVPVGDFTRARAQGPDAWDYEVDVRGSVQELTDWFNAAYASRQWTLVDSGQLRGSALGTFLVFRKGQAESRIDVEDSEVDGFSTATVVVGVGAPVLQTQ